MFAPEFSGGAACLSVPGRYWLSVAAGTVVHGSGTCCSSPGRKLVTKTAEAEVGGPWAAAQQVDRRPRSPPRPPRPPAMSSRRRLRRPARCSSRESRPAPVPALGERLNGVGLGPGRRLVRFLAGWRLRRRCGCCCGALWRRRVRLARLWPARPRLLVPRGPAPGQPWPPPVPVAAAVLAAAVSAGRRLAALAGSRDRRPGSRRSPPGWPDWPCWLCRPGWPPCARPSRARASLGRIGARSGNSRWSCGVASYPCHSGTSLS